MNKLLKLFAIIPFFFVACETDFDVTGEWQDNTVIYGILDKKDSIHEFKITKTFLGNKSAFEMAKVPDSSYYDYDEIEVYLQELDYGVMNREVKLDTSYITNKESGTFFYPNQMIYKNKEPFYLLDDKTYRVVVYKLITGDSTYVDVEVINDFSITQPFTYATTTAFYNFNASYNRYIRWNRPENAYQYEAKIRFYYTEDKNGTLTNHYADWVLVKQLDNDSDGKIVYKVNRFFGEISELIPEKQGVKRYLGHTYDHEKHVDFFITAIDVNFYTYMNLTNEGDYYNERPVFSNVNNGKGIVAIKALTKAVRYYSLSGETIDELFYGEKTRKLNFQERN